MKPCFGNPFEIYGIYDCENNSTVYYLCFQINGFLQKYCEEFIT